MASRYRYNAAAGRYTDRAGRFVSQDAVRKALDATLTAEVRRMAELAEAVRTKRISVKRFELEMRSAVKTVHLTSAAAAKGGWAQMAPADYGRAGREIRDQYAYLERMVRQIREGMPLDGRFLQRVRLYGEAGRKTYHATETAEQQLRGRTQERNRLHPADHCEQCVTETARGWVPIGTLIPIGSRLCRAQCRCTKEYR